MEHIKIIFTITLFLVINSTRGYSQLQTYKVVSMDTVFFQKESQYIMTVKKRGKLYPIVVKYNDKRIINNDTVKLHIGMVLDLYLFN